MKLPTQDDKHTVFISKEEARSSFEGHKAARRKYKDLKR